MLTRDRSISVTLFAETLANATAAYTTTDITAAFICSTNEGSFHVTYMIILNHRSPEPRSLWKREDIEHTDSASSWIREDESHTRTFAHKTYLKLQIRESRRQDWHCFPSSRKTMTLRIWEITKAKSWATSSSTPSFRNWATLGGIRRLCWTLERTDTSVWKLPKLRKNWMDLLYIALDWPELRKTRHNC